MSKSHSEGVADLSPTKHRRGLVAGGNWIVDHVKIIDAWPPQDALVNILDQTKANGGSPYNILIDLARLGAKFPLESIGLVGDDADGAYIRADCKRHGIGTRQLQTTGGAATSYTDVMTVRSTGRRTFFHQRGANALLGPEHFDFSGTTARHFHLGYALLLDRLDGQINGEPATSIVFSAARQAGLTTSLDCVSESSNRFASVVRPVLGDVDLFFANDFEVERITGIPVRAGEKLDRKAAGDAAVRLIELGVRQWAILHFPEGACACSATGDLVWQGSVRLPASEIRGAAGAGDAFAAGVLLGWHEGWGFKENLQLGVCAAASCLRDVTCSDGIAARGECLESAKQLGYRELETES